MFRFFGNYVVYIIEGRLCREDNYKIELEKRIEKLKRNYD